MAPALWVIAVLSTITVIHRIIYTWQRTREMDAPARAAEHYTNTEATCAPPVRRANQVRDRSIEFRASPVLD